MNFLPRRLVRARGTRKARPVRRHAVSSRLRGTTGTSDGGITYEVTGPFRTTSDPA
ncbi:hypothetical protein [Saccharopolyspora sp. NPDC002376]